MTAAQQRLLVAIAKALELQPYPGWQQTVQKALREAVAAVEREG